MRTISTGAVIRGALAGAVLTLGALVALQGAGAPALALAAPAAAPAVKTPGDKFADRLPSTPSHAAPGR